jgi:hypothetical protein
MNRLDRNTLILLAGSIASGFAIAFGAVTENWGVLVAGIVLLVIGPVRTVAGSRGGDSRR